MIAPKQLALALSAGGLGLGLAACDGSKRPADDHPAATSASQPATGAGPASTIDQDADAMTRQAEARADAMAKEDGGAAGANKPM